MRRNHMLIASLVIVLSLAAEGAGQFGQDANRPVTIQNEQLVITQVRDTNTFLAYSKKVGKWNRFEFPAGVTAIPVISGAVCAFQLASRDPGDAIKQIVAVDSKGNWQTTDLPAATREAVPIVSDQLAVFVIDGQAHAFSSKLGKWDSTPARVAPEVNRDTALVVHADSIAVFSVGTGRWAVADTTGNAANDTQDENAGQKPKSKRRK
jgi:hypothetical protein